MSTNHSFLRYSRFILRRIVPTGVLVCALLLGTSQISYATHTIYPSTPSEGGCTNPFALTSESSPQSTASIVNSNWYATAVVGSINVIDPENALGVEDYGYAVLTDTSVITLSFGSYFTSGIAVVLVHPFESTCNYLWLYIRHYSDLAQFPLVTSTIYTSIDRAQRGTKGDGYTVTMAPHRYVAITTNTLMWIDAVYFLVPAKQYWMPVIMRNAGI